MWESRSPATIRWAATPCGSSALGTPKGHPEISYTVEITCGLLKKAAVCWMAMAADDTALHTFERGVVTLDGESPVALVPPTAFDKKPL